MALVTAQLVLLAQVAVAAPSLRQQGTIGGGGDGSGACSFSIYPRTDCAESPYRQLESATLASCCSACYKDNQCRRFTLDLQPQAGSGLCQMALGSNPSRKMNQTGKTCGSREPLPAPSPPAQHGDTVPLAFDCGLRRLALEYAGALLDGHGQAHVFEALQIGPKCGDAPPPPPPRPPGPPPLVKQDIDSTIIEYWVSPNGSDAASGKSISSAWKTLPRVLRALEQTPAAARPPTVINMLPETLVVTAAHSGATPALPVIFKATGNVTWSGGVPLNGLSWQKDAASQAWSAKIQTPRSWRFESLYADEQRQWRARWPNGNPETYCARDLHGGHCPGYAQVGLNVSEATPCDPGECQVGSNRSNCNIFAAESGALIAEGTLRPLSAVHNLTVTTPNPSWHQRKKTFSTAAFYEKPRSPPSGMAPATAGSFQIDRFDTRFTKAFWNTAVAATLPIRPENFTDKTWAHPELAVAHVYQTEYWGIWMFQLQSVESDRILFSRGGWQEARGGSIGGRGGRGHQQDYFVENVPEELDAEREFYYNASTSTLYWIPRPSVNHPSESNLVAPAIEQLLSISANHIRFDGITFAHTLPTFMQPYEPTTGGDWAIHRGAAVMVENASGVEFHRCTWHSVEGNGVMFSHRVRDSKVTRCELVGCGDTPIVMLGSADLMDGRAGTQPWNNEISHNYIHHWGVWGRQAAGYFEGLTGNTNVSWNVFHDGPRAGANFNDGFGGGLHFEGNLLFNVVQDTGEHGATNSWDRQPMLWLVNGSSDGELMTAPATRHITQNFIFRNSFRGPTSNKWCLDKDDGSSNYDASKNVLVYGAIKARDGLWRVARSNIIVFPELMPFTDTTNTKMAMAFQVNEFAWDFFLNNTVLTTLGQIYDCGGGHGFPTTSASNLNGNTFLYRQDASKRPESESELNFFASGCSNSSGFKDWQDQGFDLTSSQHVVVASDTNLVQLVRSWLPVLRTS